VLAVKSAVKTVILQAVAHARRQERVTGISAYFDYMTETSAVDSQKLEDRDRRPQMLLARSKVPRMQLQMFCFHAGKI
jgi:hypothetical protein